MALPPLATIPELAAHLGKTIAEGDLRAGSALLHASVLVRSRAGKPYVDAEGNLVDDIPDAIGTATLMVAVRLYSNPTFASSTATGPWRAEWGTGFELTDTERDLVDQAAGGTATPKGLGTISTTRGPLETPSVSTDWDYAGPTDLTEATDPYELWR